MKLYCELYFDEELQKKKEKILKKLKQDRSVTEGYAILLADREDENLEIQPCVYLFGKRPKNMNRLLVAVVATQENAFSYVAKLTEEVYEETKGADIRRYILDKQQQYDKEGSL